MILDREKLQRAMELNFHSGYSLAKAAGVARGTVQNALDGHELRPGTLKKICEALNTTPDKLEKQV